MPHLKASCALGPFMVSWCQWGQGQHLRAGRGANLPVQALWGEGSALSCTPGCSTEGGEVIQDLDWIKWIIPTFGAVSWETAQGWFSVSSHRAHKFAFKPTQWKKKKQLILLWWWTQGTPTGAYQCTREVREKSLGVVAGLPGALE